MSHVATVMISFYSLETDEGTFLNSFLPMVLGEPRQFVPFSCRTFADLTAQEWGGSKAPQCRLFGAAINYLKIDEFLDDLLSLPWEEPSSVQIFIQDEYDANFSIYVIENAKIKCVHRAMRSCTPLSITAFLPRTKIQPWPAATSGPPRPCAASRW